MHEGELLADGVSLAGGAVCRCTQRHEEMEKVNFLLNYRGCFSRKGGILMEVLING